MVLNARMHQIRHLWVGQMLYQLRKKWFQETWSKLQSVRTHRTSLVPRRYHLSWGRSAATTCTHEEKLTSQGPWSERTDESTGATPSSPCSLRGAGRGGHIKAFSFRSPRGAEATEGGGQYLGC